ncbi:MAG: thermonuclease family protein [Acidimicrobiales bacterium]
MIKRLLAAAVLLSGCGLGTGSTSTADSGSFSTTTTTVAAPATTSTAAASAPIVPNARVMWVIDGDTIEVDLDGVQETVRLIGIDTPEKTGGLRDAECYGDEATQRMRQLLDEGEGVYLELDQEPRDQYDRLLAYVYSSDGFINELLVRDGYAAAFRYEPNTARAAQLEEAQRRAREFDLGLWGACGGPDVVLTESG